MNSTLPPQTIDALKASVSIAAVVSQTLPLRRNGQEFVACCPFHAERSPSFTVKDDKRFFHCFGCGAHGDVFDWLMRTRQMSLHEAVHHLGGQFETTPRSAPIRISAEPVSKPEKETVEVARRLWTEAVPPGGTPVEAYLNSRGLTLPADAPLRFHPSCAHGHPGMVALMTDPATAKPQGIHRTLLRPDGSGKAEVEKTKLMLGNSGIIRLCPDEQVTGGLGLAEGIETALGVMQSAGWRPVWACGSAGAIRTFPVLAGIEALTIFADADDSGAGVDAARTCATRWAEAGRETTLYIPPPGQDWLDVTQAVAA